MQKNLNGADRKPKHRKGDAHESEMIIQDDAEDASQQNLISQNRECNDKNTRKMRAALRIRL